MKKLIYLLLLITSIPIILLSFEVIQQITTREVSNAKLIIRTINEKKQADIDIFMNNLVNITYHLAEMDPSKDALKDIYSLYDGIDLIYSAYEDGSINIFPEINLPAKFNPIERPWYTKAKKNNAYVVFSDVYKDIRTGKKIISISKALVKDNIVKGVIGLDININNLYKNIDSRNYYNSQYTIICDSMGKIIFDKENKNVGKTLSIKLSAKNDYSEVMMDKKEKIVKINYVEKLNWFIVTFIDKSEIYSSITPIIQRVGIFFCIALLFMLAIQFIIYKLVKKIKISQEIEKSNSQLSKLNSELETSNYQLSSLSQKFETLINITSKIILNKEVSESEFFKGLLNAAFSLVPEADYGTISLVRDGEWHFVSAVGHDLNKLNLLPLKASYMFSSEGVSVVEDIFTKNKNIPEEIKKDFIAASKPVKHTLVATLRDEDETLGNITLDISEKSDKNFSRGSMRAIYSLVNIASAFITYKRYNKIKQDFEEDIILSMINILEVYDPYTKGHSKNVADLSKEIAVELKLSDDQVEKVFWAGLLHDIGKILVPPAILNKPGRLTEEEFAYIRKHPVNGYNFLIKHVELSDIAEVVLHHHERYNGTGYPSNLKGDKIPYYSRIIAVADCYDAMIGERSYKPGLPYEEVLEEIEINKSRYYDPEVVDAFFRVLEKSNLKEDKKTPVI